MSRPSPRLVYILGGVILLSCIVFGVSLVSREKEVPLPQEPVREPKTAPIDLPATSTSRVIGTSVLGRPIELMSFGTGSTSLLFVGGIHGGYEWNSVMLAYNLIDYLSSGEFVIPEALTIHVIPSLNPDGVFTVVGKEGRFKASDIPPGTDTSKGRFNANGVDLNRNFDCKWQSKATWRGNTVSAGTGPFSEPEAQVLRNLVEEMRPSGVVFWHSKANAVYASECTEGILDGTRLLMDTYATHSGYRAIDTFDAYPVTGDAEGWLASIDIPAITVELASHEDIEWEKNREGITAIIHTFAPQENHGTSI